MAALPVAEIGILRPFQVFLERGGASSGPWMRTVGVSPDQVAAGDGWITKSQAYGFMRAAARGEGIPDLGYRVGRSFHFDVLGPIGSRMRSCETLKESLDMLSVFIRHVASDNRVWLSRDGDQTWLCNDSGDTSSPGSEYGVQLGAMVFLQLVRSAAGAASWTPSEVRFESDPGHAHEAVPEFAGARPGFRSACTAIRFPLEFLARPLDRRPSGGPGAQMRQPPPGFGQTLIEVIHARLPFTGVPRIEEAAEMCSVSPRTLQRRLELDGLSYRRVCDRARFRRAIELLEHPSITTDDVAFEIGYSDRRSFLRAFRRFTGMTPGEYRRVPRS